MTNEFLDDFCPDLDKSIFSEPNVQINVFTVGVVRKGDSPDKLTINKLYPQSQLYILFKALFEAMREKLGAWTVPVVNPRGLRGGNKARVGERGIGEVRRWRRGAGEVAG